MICAYKKCKGVKEFSPKTHNQKYCSDECCRIATNESLKQKYYDEKDRRNGKKRICKTPKCGSPLSRYNEGNTCGKCAAEQAAKKKREIIAMVERASFRP